MILENNVLVNFNNAFNLQCNANAMALIRKIAALPYYIMSMFQVHEELVTMNESRENNAQLLHNILPGHVVSHFLSAQRSPDVSTTYTYTGSVQTSHIRCKARLLQMCPSCGAMSRLWDVV